MILAFGVRSGTQPDEMDWWWYIWLCMAWCQRTALSHHISTLALGIQTTDGWVGGWGDEEKSQGEWVDGGRVVKLFWLTGNQCLLITAVILTTYRSSWENHEIRVVYERILSWGVSLSQSSLPRPQHSSSVVNNWKCDVCLIVVNFGTLLGLLFCALLGLYPIFFIPVSPWYSRHGWLGDRYQVSLSLFRLFSEPLRIQRHYEPATDQPSKKGKQQDTTQK